MSESTGPSTRDGRFELEEVVEPCPVIFKLLEWSPGSDLKNLLGGKSLPSESWANIINVVLPSETSILYCEIVLKVDSMTTLKNKFRDHCVECY